jgi:MYXO-CTERM domain-containing protein
LLALMAACAAVSSVHAAALVPLYWAEGSTSAAGVYSYESPGAAQIGVSIFGVIPTNALQGFPDNDVVNYFRTVSDLPGALTAYNAVLLGNLSAYGGLTATFNLFDTALAAGAPFPASALVGETYPGQVGSNAGIRLMFMGGYYNDPSNGVTPNEWWSNPAVAYVTSMNNGQDVTLTVAFDPSLWSNYYGHMGNENAATETQFQDALSGVTRLGLSFGSGYFFSDGFAFDTGGSAQIQLDGIGATDAAPEPGTWAMVTVALCALGFLRRRSGS